MDERQQRLNDRALIRPALIAEFGHTFTESWIDRVLPEIRLSPPPQPERRVVTDPFGQLYRVSRDGEDIEWRSGQNGDWVRVISATTARMYGDLLLYPNVGDMA